MALANFFGKNALAASQVLDGMTPESLSVILNQHVVGIAFDELTAASHEGRTTVELAVNLAARLYPVIAVLRLGSPGAASDELGERVERLAKSINPDIELIPDARRVTVAVVVGTTPFAALGAASRVIYAGSSAWLASISATLPVGSGTSQNPFGAAAAACFALANVFRAVFSDRLPAPDLDEGFVLSLFDYKQHADLGDVSTGGPALPRPVDIGTTILAGVGAIGTAAVWTLGRLPGLQGSLELIDDQTITLTNLQRYVLATQEHVANNTNKVTLAVNALSHAGNENGLVLVPQPLLWGEYLRRRADYRIERVATAFDTVDARLAVQAALPRRILNAWTQQGDLGVSRHLVFGTDPCLNCIYPSRAGGKSEAELVAEAMVVPEPAMQIRELLYSGAAVGEEFIRGVANRRGILASEKVEPLLRFAHAPLRVFYQEAFCGGLVLELGGEAGGPTVRAETPVAFQSALAGVMLAAEMVIDAGGLRGPADASTIIRTTVDLLRPLSVYSPTITRRRDGKCLCEDADYRNAYDTKYTGTTVTV